MFSYRMRITYKLDRLCDLIPREKTEDNPSLSEH